MEEFRKTNNLNLCIHGADPSCTESCPLGLDVRSFINKLQRGESRAAYRLYRNAAVFPAITWRLCSEPCRAACLRSAVDSPVSLRQLERACTQYAGSTETDRFNLPRKDKRVAIIGSGLSGLTCALKLAAVKYQVDVYEKKSIIGGRLSSLLPVEVYTAEIERQFFGIEYELHLDWEVGSLAEIEYDAVYLSYGARVGGDTLLNDVFICQEDLSPLEEIKEGIAAYQEIEWYLKTGNRPRSADGGPLLRLAPRPPVEAETSRFAFLIDGIEPKPVIVPSDEGAFTEEESFAEAKRCVLCDCAECLESCELLKRYNSYPAKLQEEVDITMNPNPLQHGRLSVREIGLCTLCGLCKRVCPVGVDIGDYLLRSKRDLFNSGAFPIAFHEYWLRDMDFADSDEAAFVIPPAPGASSVFFPGCQAGGSDPRYVTETYRKLLESLPGTGLILGCCGVPALWAGDRDRFDTHTATLISTWDDMGRPKLLTLCPTCTKTLAEYAPEIPCKTVYEVFAEEQEVGTVAAPTPTHKAAIFDPCSSCGDPTLQKAARMLARKSGYELTELPASHDKARCCGWGGQPYTADSAFLREQAESRVSQSELPFITYCTNCRDILSASEKECVHILDLLFDLGEGTRRSPTVTERQHNRRSLKATLTADYTSVTITPPLSSPVGLVMNDELAQSMSRDLILEEDVAAVIAHCEETGRKLERSDTGRFIGHLRRGFVTYWVEYEPVDEKYLLHKVYCHRMSLKE